MSGSPILRVAARGDGMTEDGRHAAFAAPGDTLTSDGAVIPGPHHQMPPCRHFPTCGGCQLQHLDDASYAGFVAERVATALVAQNLSATVRAPLVSPPRTRRRATLHAEGKGGRVRLGFAAAASHDIVDLHECHILAPELFALVGPLRKLLARMKLRRRADVQMTLIDGGVDICLAGVTAEGLAATEALTNCAQAHGLARLTLDEGYGPEPRWEPQPATITLAGVPVPFPAGGFLQATAEGEAALVAAVREAVVGAVGAPMATVDLFAGLGTFALALPGRVHAAEAARNAVLALKSAGPRAGRALTVEHRDLFRRPVTPEELSRFDAAVIDPPRAGAQEQVAALAASVVPIIAYVSCNPASFARDAKTLVEGGYQLDWVQPVGQFRWSTHVELAARFVR